jgi:putative ABC transport system permease protein
MKYYAIDQWGLLVALLMVLAAAGLAAYMRLHVSGSLLLSCLRSFLQLVAMGFILGWVIKQGTWYIVVALVALMITASVQITISRASGIPQGLGWPIFLTQFITTLLMVGIVAEGIVRPKPWYSPQVIIPITGMMLGNTVGATAVGLTRFYESMKSRQDEIESMLALGATPWEASRPSVLSSVKLGLTPTIATLASSGIVMIPGMMAGQVLAGANPVNAAVYQFVILAAMSSLTLVSTALILRLVYRTCFTTDDQYKPVVPRQKTSRGLGKAGKAGKAVAKKA